MTGDKTALRYLATLLEQRTGQQIGPNRLWRVETVLKSLTKDKGLAGLDALVRELGTGRDPNLAAQVVEALLNNETFFFRDTQAFDQLRTSALETLRTTRVSTRRLSIWCAGCSTGQEAYSLAMMFADDPARWGDWTIDITATDVSERAAASTASSRSSGGCRSVRCCAGSNRSARIGGSSAASPATSASAVTIC
jgi:chemotaxis protein methyltransferase CheR